MPLAVAADVDICANALRLLGDDPIQSLTEDSDRARLCNALYAPTRDAVFRSYPWNCLLARATLAKLTAAPLWDWGAQYQLPTDPFCLRVLETDSQDTHPWKIEGRLLLTDASSIEILFIARVTDVAQYDALLVDALTYRIAEKLAYPVTGSLEKAKGFRELYKDVLLEAASRDGQEGSVQILEVTQLTDVR
jgi:hypothetical protein